jgi:integrase/recombinase XerD
VHKDAEYHLTKRELERLISGAESERDRALITLFVETGIRRFEAAKLVTEDLDVKHGILIVRNGKGRKLRMLPLSPRLLETQLVKRPNKYPRAILSAIV